MEELDDWDTACAAARWLLGCALMPRLLTSLTVYSSCSVMYRGGPAAELLTIRLLCVWCGRPLRHLLL